MNFCQLIKYQLLLLQEMLVCACVRARVRANIYRPISEYCNFNNHTNSFNCPILYCVWGCVRDDKSHLNSLHSLKSFHFHVWIPTLLTPYRMPDICDETYVSFNFIFYQLILSQSLFMCVLTNWFFAFFFFLFFLFFLFHFSSYVSVNIFIDLLYGHPSNSFNNILYVYVRIHVDKCAS